MPKTASKSCHEGECVGPSLSAQIDAAAAPYRQDYESIIRGWVYESGTFGLTYPALLVETYHQSKHSSALIEAAWRGVSPTRVTLRDYLERHVEEERGHEQWALNDFAALGYDRDVVTRSQPLAETIELIGGQLYVIHYLKPVGILGYLYLTETAPPTAEFLRAVQDAFAISDRAMTYLWNHAEHDVAHGREVREVLDTLIEGDDEAEAVKTGALLAQAGINRMLARVRDGNFVASRPLLTGGRSPESDLKYTLG
ncbi:MAG: iron-containing redox enzyme family protein [Caulobacterales bacterium]